MRLEITRRAELAVRAMSSLASAGRPLKGAELATALETTAGFVPQIVGPLVKAGWVRSDPGPTGGYRLVAPPDDLSVLQVIEAIDGPTDAGRCVVVDRPCDARDRCILHDAWADARAELVRTLDATRLTALGSGRPRRRASTRGTR